MFTDMVGFTALTQSDEAQSLEVLEKHNRLLRPIFQKFRGREVKTIGDSFLVEFDNALDATNCAVEVERFLHDYNVSTKDEWKITLRIGVHLGDVVHRDGDVFGDAVNIASRLQPLAEREGVCISEQVYDQVRNKIPQNLVKLEPHELKGVKFAVDVYKIVMPWEGDTRQMVSEGVPYDPLRIAVLPLVNMISDSSEEYFADGMTEELISAVSKVPQLSVISRTSVMGYKSQTRKVSEISRELSVGTLLEGSVRKAGNTVRVAVQLIDANHDKHLWAENYDRKLEDVFSIQNDIAENVAMALKVQLLKEDREKLERVPTRSPEALELFMKGRSAFNDQSESGLEAALGFFERAIVADPSYVAPYAWMALAYNNLAFHEIMPVTEASAKVEELGRKAVGLDPTSPEAHLAMAFAYNSKRDRVRETTEVEFALKLNPKHVEALIYRTQLLVHARQFDMVHDEIPKYLELDPLSMVTMQFAATQYLYSDSPEKAAELYLKIISLDPSNSFAVGNLGICYIREGEYELGLAQVEKSIKMESEIIPNSLADLPYALSKLGRIDEAKKVVERLVKYYEANGTGAGSVARGYGAIGERDKAIDWMEKAYTEGSLLVTSLSVDFNFEGMRSDPRFKAFLEKIGSGS